MGNAEMEALQAALNQICEEGTRKMGSATEQVRAIRIERAEAFKEIERLDGDNKQLTAKIAELEEQKRSLMKIVEDLHLSCMGAGVPGLSDATRRSITSITNLGL